MQAALLLAHLLQARPPGASLSFLAAQQQGHKKEMLGHRRRLHRCLSPLLAACSNSGEGVSQKLMLALCQNTSKHTPW
jgi:hypothetical protein